MDTPQEVEVWFVLPALRRHYVAALKKEGLKQKDIASIVNLTEAAISQYLKKKRGDAITFNNDVLQEIQGSAKKIVSKEATYRKEFQNILKKLKHSRFICTVCHDHINADEECEICYR